MRIGELATQTGVSVQTVRFYERRGLLPVPGRSAGGYRQYSERDLEIVHTIKRLQRFGCTLSEVRRVLELYWLPASVSGRTPYARGSHECLREIAEIGERKLNAIDEQIQSLVAVREELLQALGPVRAKLLPTRRKAVSRRTLKVKARAS